MSTLLNLFKFRKYTICAIPYTYLQYVPICFRWCKGNINFSLHVECKVHPYIFSFKCLVLCKILNLQLNPLKQEFRLITYYTITYLYIGYFMSLTYTPCTFRYFKHTQQLWFKRIRVCNEAPSTIRAHNHFSEDTSQHRHQPHLRLP